MQSEQIEAIWGAAGISQIISAPLRRTFDLLERGLLPARKVGGIWQSTRGELHDFLLGVTQSPTREVPVRRVAEVKDAPPPDVRRRPPGRRSLRRIAAQAREPADAEPLA
jgi:hypothetical protein